MRKEELGECTSKSSEPWVWGRSWVATARGFSLLRGGQESFLGAVDISAEIRRMSVLFLFVYLSRKQVY